MNLITGSKIGLMLLALVLLPGQSGCANTDPAAEAWGACKLFVQNRTGLPPDDAAPFNPADAALLAPGHYLVSVHYAKAGGAYRCDILRRPDGNWQLLSLDFLH